MHDHCDPPHLLEEKAKTITTLAARGSIGVREIFKKKGVEVNMVETVSIQEAMKMLGKTKVQSIFAYINQGKLKRVGDDRIELASVKALKAKLEGADTSVKEATEVIEAQGAKELLIDAQTMADALKAAYQQGRADASKEAYIRGREDAAKEFLAKKITLKEIMDEYLPKVKEAS